jgi:hypothetical protein
MQQDWYKEMQKQIVSLANDAVKAADAPLDMRDGLVQLVIQRAIVFGHQECMRRLREQGVLEGGTVREMAAVKPVVPEHHCGVMGWRPDLGDAPCPACEHHEKAYRARRAAKMVQP